MCCCIGSVMKVVLFVSNVLVFVMSGVVLGVSIWALVDDTSFSTLLDLASEDTSINVATTVPILLIVCSTIVLVTTFFGCCGAIKENKCYLILYVLIIGGFIAAFIAGAITVSVQDLAEELEDPLYNTLEKYDPNTDNSISQAWDDVMEEFECCGVKDYTDWVERNDNFADPPRPNRPTVPDVCCERLSTAALVNQCKTKPSLYADRSFMNGCLTQIEEALEENEDIVMWVTIGALLIMASNCIAALLVIVPCC